MLTTLILIEKILVQIGGEMINGLDFPSDGDEFDMQNVEFPSLFVSEKEQKKNEKEILFCLHSFLILSRCIIDIQLYKYNYVFMFCQKSCLFRSTAIIHYCYRICVCDDTGIEYVFGLKLFK